MGNRVDGVEGEGGTVAVMIIGNNNVFEVGSVSQSLKIGDSNILEAKSYVGRGTSLSHGCIIGAGCHLTTDEVLTENSVIYGGQCSRRAAKERPAPQHLQIDFLSKVLPNYHHLKKPAKKPAAPPAASCQNHQSQNPDPDRDRDRYSLLYRL